MAKFTVDPDNKQLLDHLRTAKEGDTFQDDNGSEILVEHIFDEPTHFAFHQRIFPAGIILKVVDSNARIFIEAEKVGIKAKAVKEGQFNDKQIKDGKVLPADRGK